MHRSAFLLLALLAAAPAQAARDVVIPAAALPGGGDGYLRVELELVDDTGRRIPASLVGNTAVIAGLGTHEITDVPVTITLATQDEINGESYYRVHAVQDGQHFGATVQVPAGDGSNLTWAEFLGLSAPVDPAPSLLLPDPALLADDLYLVTDGNQWTTTGATGSGIPEAPQDGTQYCRVDGAWAECEGGGVGTETDPVFVASPAAGLSAQDLIDYAAAFDWGNHASAGYLTSYTESDPVAVAAIAGLGAADVGADPAGTGASEASAAVSAHAGAADPHIGYLLESAAATVATSGAYTDLSGLPTLGTAAATDASVYATAAQGGLAASAVQPSDLASGTITPASGNLDLSAIGGGSSVWWTDVNYSTDANPAPDCDEQYLIDASAWAAVRTLILPTCSYGQRVAVMMEAVSTAGGLIITGDINGQVGEIDRFLVPGERMALMSVGSNEWMVESGGRIKTVATIMGDNLAPHQTNGEAAGAFFEVATMDDLSAVAQSWTAYAGDPAVTDDGSTLTARRSGTVLVCGGWNATYTASANGWVQIIIQNTVQGSAVAPRSTVLSGDSAGNAGCFLDTAAIGDSYRIRVRSSVGNLGANYFSGNFLTIAEQ